MLEINHALSSLRAGCGRSGGTPNSCSSLTAPRVKYQPKGVVGIITPWNFPLYLSLGPLVAALAAGNRVMIKMSELSPRTTELLANMLRRIFAEDEVAVFGGEVEASQAFSQLPFNHIVFTGSPAVGHHVMRAASENLTPVTLELGGKSPALRRPRRRFAEPPSASRTARPSAAARCASRPDYALVPRDQRQRVRRRRGAIFQRMYPTAAGNADYTSSSTSATRSACASCSTMRDAKGATVMSCGDDEHRRGACRCRSSPACATTCGSRKEELFGPILPVIPYDSLDDAIAYINARPRPLAFYVFGFRGDALDDCRRRRTRAA